jgi:hypothetical protein
MKMKKCKFLKYIGMNGKTYRYCNMETIGKYYNTSKSLFLYVCKQHADLLRTYSEDLKDKTIAAMQV